MRYTAPPIPLQKTFAIRVVVIYAMAMLTSPATCFWARAAPVSVRSAPKVVVAASFADRQDWASNLPKTLDDILRCYSALPGYITGAWVHSAWADETNVVTVEMTAGAEPKFRPIRCVVQDKDGFAREASIELGDYQRNFTSPPPYFAVQPRHLPRAGTLDIVEVKDSFGISRGYLGSPK